MYENQISYNRNDIEAKLQKTASEIETLVESDNFDDEKYTKLMFEQLLQGLYLQNVNMY